jgi:hypothetical protein
MTNRKKRMHLARFKWLRRLFAGVATLCVATIAMVMLAAGGVMLFSVATGSEVDKSRLVRTAPASIIAPAVAASSPTTKPAAPSVAEVVNRRPVTDAVDRREQPVAEVVDRREPPPKRTVKQKPKPKFAQHRPTHSHPWGGPFQFR